jgi:hypothetical protein
MLVTPVDTRQITDLFHPWLKISALLLGDTAKIPFLRNLFPPVFRLSFFEM